VGGVWGPADFAKRSASEAGLHTSPAVTTNFGGVDVKAYVLAGVVGHKPRRPQAQSHQREAGYKGRVEKKRRTQPIFAALKARSKRGVTILGVGRSGQHGS
jgi:hypothetical protein